MRNAHAIEESRLFQELDEDKTCGGVTGRTARGRLASQTANNSRIDLLVPAYPVKLGCPASAFNSQCGGRQRCCIY
jgi:hypothetical protein